MFCHRPNLMLNLSSKKLKKCSDASTCGGWRQLSGGWVSVTTVCKNPRFFPIDDPQPNSQPNLIPTYTPRPTSPTSTPNPTGTPTSTPSATSTPAPSQTPTRTPLPSQTPTLTPTPTFSYSVNLTISGDEFVSATGLTFCGLEGYTLSYNPPSIISGTPLNILIYIEGNTPEDQVAMVTITSDFLGIDFRLRTDLGFSYYGTFLLSQPEIYF
jgi:hypothetical protein